MATTVIELTDDQKIQILEKTKELLGPNGEGWTKACWWGIKTTDAELFARLNYFGYSTEGLTKEEIAQFDVATDYEIGRQVLAADQADQANVWCLMGALEESAYRLGIITERQTSERLANPISLQNLVNNKTQWRDWSVIDVNDNPNTTFEMVRDLLDERLVQLRA